MQIWSRTILLFMGFIGLSTQQDKDFEIFKDISGPPSQSYYPELFDLSESTYYSEDDGDQKKSFKTADTYVGRPKIENDYFREKRETPDEYDYGSRYRDFVRENFGIYENPNSYIQDDENEDEESSDDGDDIQGYAEDASEDNDEGSSGYCKVYYKNGKECTVCKNPKTNAHSENCSYSSKPKPKKYAYKEEVNYGKNGENNDDDDDDEENDYEEEASEKQERISPKPDAEETKKVNSTENISKATSHKTRKTHQTTSEPESPSFDDYAFRQPYPKSDMGSKVGQVLEEFKTRDWSKCRRKSKNGITCYYCKDDKGATNEECMYISDEEGGIKAYNQNVENLGDTSKMIVAEVTKRPKLHTRRIIKPTKKRSNIPQPEETDTNPTEKRSFKRMISVKVQEDGEQDPAAHKEMFYKRVIENKC